MLRLAGERDRLNVVDDQVGCPTFTGHLAAALVRIAEERLAGLRHVAGAGACSWYDLAAATFAATGAEVALDPRPDRRPRPPRAAPRLLRPALRAPGHPRPPAVAGRAARLPRTGSPTA